MDPLDVLRGPETPTDPDPTFAADLRRRLVRALTGGDTMSTSTSAPTGLRHGDVSYVTLGVPDAVRAIAFYGAVLGWEVTPTDHGGQVPGCSPMVGIGEGVTETGAHLAYRVDDLAVAVAAVRSQGGTATDPVDRGYALESECRDPGGLLLWLHQFPAGSADAVPGFPPGGISYVSLLVPDGERARAFYAAVLGWEFVDGNPAGTTPRLGMWSGPLPTGDPMHHGYGAVPSYTVTDLAAAVEAVRAAGGTAREPEQRPYALSSACVDDQGLPLYLHQY